MINPQLTPRKGTESGFQGQCINIRDLLKKARLPTLRNRRLQEADGVNVQRQKWTLYQSTSPNYSKQGKVIMIYVLIKLCYTEI